MIVTLSINTLFYVDTILHAKTETKMLDEDWLSNKRTLGHNIREKCAKSCNILHTTFNSNKSIS